MPRRGPSASDGTAATPATLLREAEAALEAGERRQRIGEDAKAIEHFVKVCSSLASMREDPKGCLLWATAMANLSELGATSWSGSMGDMPSLHLAASALERGHAAAVAAEAPSDERAHLLAARAECAGLIRESLSDDWRAAISWAAEAATLWEESLVEELAAQSASQHTPEAAVETLCSVGYASMAFGKLALAHGAESLDGQTRHAAQAAVKRALDAYEEACALCDST